MQAVIPPYDTTEALRAAEEVLRQAKANAAEARRLQARNASLRRRTLMELRDEPGPSKRFCVCGADVYSLILAGGGELLRCDGGHEPKTFIVGKRRGS